MRVAVVGAGGVGGYFGARLAAAGTDVAFIARGEHGRAMATTGLRVRSPLGDVHLPEVRVTDDAGSIEPCDVVLFCVKSFSTDEAAREHLPALLGSGTAVISLQNGVGNLARIEAVTGPEHVVGGLALIFATISEPGVVQHTGGPARIVFGERDGTVTDRLTRFHERCAAAGIDAQVSAAVDVAMWDKFAFICALAGATAAVRLPIGDIRRAPHAWRMVRTLVDETYTIARAEGVAVAEDAAEQVMRQADALAPEATSSLYHDLTTGRRLELDALQGEVVRRAHRHGIAVPMSEAIHAVLEPWAVRHENAARNEGGRPS